MNHFSLRGHSRPALAPRDALTACGHVPVWHCSLYPSRLSPKFFVRPAWLKKKKERKKEEENEMKRKSKRKKGKDKKKVN